MKVGMREQGSFEDRIVGDNEERYAEFQLLMTVDFEFLHRSEVDVDSNRKRHRNTYDTKAAERNLNEQSTEMEIQRRPKPLQQT